MRLSAADLTEKVHFFQRLICTYVHLMAVPFNRPFVGKLLPPLLDVAVSRNKRRCLELRHVGERKADSKR